MTDREYATDDTGNLAAEAQRLADKVNRDPTCEERIADYMRGRAEHLAALYAVIDSGEPATVDYEELDEDSARERIDELPLSAEIIRTLRITFGTGGPADYLDVRLDTDGAPLSMTYHFADWFDHAERPVPDDSPLWRIGEEYAEIMGQPTE